MNGLEISEEILESMIIEYALDNDMTLNHTGESFHAIERQVRLGSYGIADIVCISMMPESEHKRLEIDIKIIELKKGTLDSKTISQISRYRTGVEELISQIYKDDDVLVTVTGDIIGSGFNLSDDACFCSDHSDWIDAYTYSIGVEKGVTFESSVGWKKQEPGDSGALSGLITKATESLSEELG